MQKIKPFVVLKNIKPGDYCGSCFFSSTNPDKPDEDHTKLFDGTVAYKVLGFADTTEEAQAMIREADPMRALIADQFEESIRKGDTRNALAAALALSPGLARTMPMFLCPCDGYEPCSKCGLNMPRQ